jgi:CheY-like chemotaxis protein
MQLEARANESHPCVLLVADDPDHRVIFRSFLEHRGWRVTEADAADSAYAVIDETAVGVVVVDLGGTNGWSLLETLGVRPERPRLLCVTGDARLGSRDRATRLGADGYLTKPIQLAELGDVVARLGSAAPLRRPHRPAPTASDRPALPSRDARPLVLLMDDDEDARVIYRDMLGFAGYEVLAASDGVEGLRFAEARRPDVVVTDLHMPGMNGIEVARTLRASEEPPPLIAVTADSLGIRAAEPAAGAEPLFDEVLVKPVTPGELVRRVRLYVSPSEGEAA